MKLEDLIKKYSNKASKKKEVTPLTEEEKQAINKYLQALKPGEIALVAPLTNAIAEKRYGKFSTSQRADISNLVRDYVKTLDGFEYIPRPNRFGYQPAKIRRLK